MFRKQVGKLPKELNPRFSRLVLKNDQLQMFSVIVKDRWERIINLKAPSAKREVSFQIDNAFHRGFFNYLKKFFKASCLFIREARYQKESASLMNRGLP